MNKLFKIIAILLMKYGDHILIKPTMRCQLKCDYCIVNKTTGKRPKFDELSFSFWINLFHKRKPQVVTISGGEPLIYPDIARLINHLTKNRVFVTASTNLMKLNLDIKPSKYLWFYATFHKTNKTLFEKNLYIYQMYGHNISVKEFGKQEIKGSKVKTLSEKQTTKEIEIYAPNGEKFNSWVELEKNGL